MSKINDLYGNKTEKSIWYKVGIIIVTVVMFFVNIFIIKPKEHIEYNSEFYGMMILLLFIGGAFVGFMYLAKEDYIHHVYVENTIVDMRTVSNDPEQSKYQYKIEGRNEWIDMNGKYDIGTNVITTCSIHRNNNKRKCSFFTGESTLNVKIGRVHASEHGWDFEMLLSNTPPTTAKVE